MRGQEHRNVGQTFPKRLRQAGQDVLGLAVDERNGALDILRALAEHLFAGVHVELERLDVVHLALFLVAFLLVDARQIVVRVGVVRIQRQHVRKALDRLRRLVVEGGDDPLPVGELGKVTTEGAGLDQDRLHLIQVVFIGDRDRFAHEVQDLLVFG